jgi:hypothetical protein
MTTPDIDLARLRELAEAAHPGPWHYAGLGEIHEDVTNFVIAELSYGDPSDPYTISDAQEADGNYIAAANPAAVLALLDRIAVLEKVATHAAGLLEAVKHEIGTSGVVQDLLSDYLRGEVTAEEIDMFIGNCGDCRDRLAPSDAGGA